MSSRSAPAAPQGHTADAADPEARSATEYRYALSPDGLLLSGQGQCAASLLPKAATVVAVLADADVELAPHHAAQGAGRAACRPRSSACWKTRCSKTPSRCTRPSPPWRAPGSPRGWPPPTRARLAGELAFLEKSQVFVDRVVPSSWPDDPPTGHFFETSGDAPRATTPGEPVAQLGAPRRRRRGQPERLLGRAAAVAAA